MTTTHTEQQIKWHLKYNIEGLQQTTIDAILKEVNALNSGAKTLHSYIGELFLSGVTVGELFNELQILVDE